VSPRDNTRRTRYLLPIIMAGVLVVAVVILWLFLDLVQPLPPRTVTMATGPEGGAYHSYGERYRDLLAREGFELRLLPTSGAVENLQKLNDGLSGVTIGFIQGGIANGESFPTLKSLGTMFYEPVWFFCNRNKCRGGELEGLKGGRIAIGPEGSGTHALVQQLLAESGITPKFAEFLPLPFQEGSEKLLSGDIDAMLIVTSWQSPVVRRLLAAEQIQLLSFPHTDAFVALHPFLSKMVVPSGVGDMARHRPPEGTAVLTAKASLVVREDLHPAIQYLLLETAEKIHSGPGVFRKGGEFPAAESVDFSLSDEARRYYRFGEPLLQRFLPFWMAVMIGRLTFILLPLVGLLYPLLRFAPALYEWKMRQRLLRFYKDLRAVELALASTPVGSDPSGLVAQLDQLESRIDRLWLPTSVMGHLYTFKEHIKLVRERLAGTQRDPS